MKGQEVSIRMGTPADNILLAELGKRSFYGSFAKDNTPEDMAAYLNLAREKGCDVIWLDEWEEKPCAIAFYQKWGFEIVGTQKFQLGSDLQHDFVMSKKVQMV